MSTNRTTSDGDTIPCPHCGALVGDLDDHRWNNDTVETECGTCEKPFTLTRIVSVDYTAEAEVP